MGEFIVAVKSLIVYNKKVLLLQKSGGEWMHNENKWEFAGGCLEFGESLSQGLAREVFEETGLTVRTDRLLCASTHVPASPAHQKQFVFLYYLSRADTDEVKLSGEHKNFLWACREQMIDLLDKPVWDDLVSNAIPDTLDIESRVASANGHGLRGKPLRHAGK
ncbi:MAG: hypothetical protein BWY35_00324 [Firmicutes bacterium ADurb.Bin248]|jgi:8-oxo-dGTP diphosphatase|nr:MAG: hypothetical protein BWY35_00324 [Firmicutes bacterium ADurb.Bin248]HOG00404.1 NUDIX domain-containing protein [Clostridia bacterium]HPK15804.1 NUDIX domain-containing protein [Clostridia bacterium]